MSETIKLFCSSCNKKTEGKVIDYDGVIHTTQCSVCNNKTCGVQGVQITFSKGWEKL